MLSKMDWDVLAVPVFTIASESAFNIGWHILDPFQSSLSPNMVQALVCTRNWLQALVLISLRKVMDEVVALKEVYDWGKILNF